ncbi:DUF1360 domain-containing protein [Mesobacillus campisalis]|nr:DUF1360 domain-containing protein [Mesobacillus campisalis]
MFSGFGMEMILIFGLASFRLTRLIVFDKITEWLRSPFFEELIEEGEIYLVPQKSGVRRWIGELLSCYWCTGIWTSAILLAVYVFIPAFGLPVILGLAIAAVGSIIESFITKGLGD